MNKQNYNSLVINILYSYIPKEIKNTIMKKAYIIARCSTNENRQEVKRQSSQLYEKYKSNYEVVGTEEYYASGLSNEDYNKKILTDAISLNVQIIIVSEISRISRTVKGVIDFTELTRLNGISVLIDDKNLQTLNDDGTENDITKMILSIGACFAEIELKTTLSRLQSGYRYYRSQNGKVGRPKGKTSKEELLAKHSDVVRQLKKSQSVRNTAKICNKSVSTIQRVKKALES